MLQESGTETKIFLKGVPVFQLRTKRRIGEVGPNVIEDDAYDIERGTMATSEEIWWDAKEAAKGCIFGAVDGW